MDAKNKREGHVYVLTSSQCEFIKIGGTDYLPGKRIREINATEPYKSLGPWSLHDYRQVTDWRQVELSLHYTFKDSQVTNIEGQRELFAVPPVVASKHLKQLDTALLLRKPKVDRMFQDEDFSSYLIRLFHLSGLMNWVEYQGSWTFSLFPTTGRGRYFTLNIGSHEVAFATSVSKECALPIHMVLMDRLILDYPDVLEWVAHHGGEVRHDQYSSGLDRSSSVLFVGDFEEAKEFLALNGVRRAIVAYWTEALLGLQERQVGSVFARYHNWNAIAELRNRLATDSAYR
nr:GIY-YIG nuclease family protein [uncultured Rhodoferax sp.]